MKKKKGPSVPTNPTIPVYPVSVYPVVVSNFGSNYLRPGGVDTYRRPGGVDRYKRP